MEDRQYRLKENTMPDPLEELRQSLERFAEAFVATVVRDLKRSLDELAAAYPPVPKPIVVNDPFGVLGKVAGRCPITKAHARHVWRFPDSDQTRECPGVKFPEEPCLRTDLHLDHAWEHLAPTEGDPVPVGSLGRWCPGGKSSVPAERQCPDNLAHHEHTWFLSPHVSGPCNQATIGAVKHGCPGQEYDREVFGCPNLVDGDHGAHEWGSVPMFCKGFREVPGKRCLAGKAHDAHNWEDTDGTKACPGRGIFGTNVVPAGPDRHA